MSISSRAASMPPTVDQTLPRNGNYYAAALVLGVTGNSVARHMTLDIREKYWKPLEGRHKVGAWEALDAGYSEPHRAYHTWEHVASLLKKLSEFSDLSIRSDILAVSVIWHDAVHQTQNHDGSVRSDYDNVRDSAELFRQYTLLSKSDADAVYDLIMATANHRQARATNHHYAGFAGDLDLFLDLDLSSLASPWEEFAEDLTRIRSEYSWAPEGFFCLRQIQLLENFAREDAQLYRRTETREKWHRAAKANLRRCVSELQKELPICLPIRVSPKHRLGTPLEWPADRWPMK